MAVRHYLRRVPFSMSQHNSLLTVTSFVIVSCNLVGKLPSTPSTEYCQHSQQQRTLCRFSRTTQTTTLEIPAGLH